MTDKFRIEFDWLDHHGGGEIDRAFAASIGLSVGENYLTQIDDLVSKSVRNQMRGCAWHLATWFAANWWRLRWEPEPSLSAENIDWRMAHSMASAGGGYVWPNVIFASDGESMEVVMDPSNKNPAFEPIRYINHTRTHISAAEFELRVDDFMDSVLSRLDSFGVEDKSIVHLWSEILDERQSAEATERRKLEAMAGYDPDEAADTLLSSLIEDRDNLGKTALEEVVAAARKETHGVLQTLQGLNGSTGAPHENGFRGSLPELKSFQTEGTQDREPWQIAAQLARDARDAWGLGTTKPIQNRVLGGLVNAKSEVFTEKSKARTPMPFALRSRSTDAFDIYFSSSNTTARRFALSRLIGDHLYFRNHERLLPATKAKTSRQKFQRAFAQEFLCPIKGLLDKIQTLDPDQEDIEEAASHFHVSPWTVRTTLVNNHQLDRTALSWND